MKKVYSKPEIIFESFTLSTNIAGDCNKIVGNPSEGSCGVPGDAPFSNLFTADITGADGCHIPLDKNDVYDGFCYHNPTDDNDLFNS